MGRSHFGSSCSSSNSEAKHRTLAVARDGMERRQMVAAFRAMATLCAVAVATATSASGMHARHLVLQMSCSLCANSNTAKAKVCKVCSLQRAATTRRCCNEQQYNNAAGRAAQAILAQSKPHPKSFAHPVTAQLQLASMLSSELALPLQQNTAGYGPSVTQKSANQTVGVSQETSQELLNRLTALENAMQVLPANENFIAPRKALQTDIDLVKRKITELSPLPDRIVLARQGLDRALNRASKAEDFVRAALTAQETATTEVTKLKTELAAMEAQVINQHTSTSGENSLQQLRGGMERVLSDMSSGSVAADVMSGARSQMEAVFKNLATLSEQQQQQQQLQLQQHQLQHQEQLQHQQQLQQQHLMQHATAAQQQHQIPVPASPQPMTPHTGTSPMVMMMPINAQIMQQGIAH